jgi:hypothetical protein
MKSPIILFSLFSITSSLFFSDTVLKLDVHCACATYNLTIKQERGSKRCIPGDAHMLCLQYSR